MPSIQLNNQIDLPQIGFGVFRIPDDDTERAVHTAIECGYRSIDTASLYGNEAGVGRAIATCGLPRRDLFITTKLWNDEQGYDSVFREFEASLSRLGLDYVDLYLIHWPKPAQNRYIETWTAFEKLYADERARAIGVSNFQIAHLEMLLDRLTWSRRSIRLNCIRIPTGPLRRFHAANGIATVAWSPLGQGQALQDPVIAVLGQRHARTPAQIVLRWHLQLGNVAIPKSTHPLRIRENIAGLDFELSEADMAALGRLDAAAPAGPRPRRPRRPTQARLFQQQRAVGRARRLTHR